MQPGLVRKCRCADIGCMAVRRAVQALIQHAADEGQTIMSEALLAVLEPGAAAAAGGSAPPIADDNSTGTAAGGDVAMGPAARALVEEKGLDATAITGSGKGGRITKEDVQAHLSREEGSGAPPATPASAPTLAEPAAFKELPRHRRAPRVNGLKNVSL